MDASTRRTLGAALQTAKLNEEQLAFVTGRAPERTIATETVPLRANPTPVPPASNGVLNSPPTTVTPALSGTLSMTFRLPADLATTLMRVALERKLRREDPFSQQDIVAEALRDWMLRHGSPR
jgi:hypothetical protein